MFIQNASLIRIIQFNRDKSKNIMNMNNSHEQTIPFVRRDNPNVPVQNPKENKISYQNWKFNQVKRFPTSAENSVVKPSKGYQTPEASKGSNQKITGLEFARDKILEPSNVQPLGFGMKKPSPRNPINPSIKLRRGSHDCGNVGGNEVYASQICFKQTGGTPKLGLESLARPVATEQDVEDESPLQKFKPSIINFKNFEPPNQATLKFAPLNFSNLDKKQNNSTINSPVKITNNLDYLKNKKPGLYSMIKTESSQSQISVNSLENLSETNSPIKITNAKSCQEIDLINAPTTSKTTSSCVRPPIPGLIFRKKTLNSREDTKCSSARFGTSSEKSNSPTKPWRRALTISDFMIGKKLGNGRYGDVFAAKHKELGFVCAMKIISKNLIRQQKIQDQFVRQLKIQCYLNHANITTMYGYFHDIDNVYLLLEICRDGHLMKVLQTKERGRMTQGEVKQIIYQICQGVEYLHRQHVLHRDIKPQNIIIHEGLFKLCDFGWARYTQNEMSQTFCGSPLYVSPEILKGELYDAKIDVWSIGILTYEMLFGKPPFKINTQHDLGRIITDQISFPEHIEVSRDAKDFITCILKKNPQQRYDIDDLLDHPFLRNHQKGSCTIDFGLNL